MPTSSRPADCAGQTVKRGARIINPLAPWETRLSRERQEAEEEAHRRRNWMVFNALIAQVNYSRLFSAQASDALLRVREAVLLQAGVRLLWS